MGEWSLRLKTIEKFKLLALKVVAIAYRGVRLREIKNNRTIQITSLQSGRDRLQRRLLTRGFDDSYSHYWKKFVCLFFVFFFWKSSRLRKVVAHEGSTVVFFYS